MISLLLGDVKVSCRKFSSGRREDVSREIFLLGVVKMFQRGNFLLGVVKRVQGAFFVATCSIGDFRASLMTTKVELRILRNLGDDRRA